MYDPLKNVPKKIWNGLFICGDGGADAELPSSDGYNYCHDNLECPCGSCCFCQCTLKNTAVPQHLHPWPSDRRKPRNDMLTANGNDTDGQGDLGGSMLEPLVDAIMESDDYGNDTDGQGDLGGSMLEPLVDAIMESDD